MSAANAAAEAEVVMPTYLASSSISLVGCLLSFASFAAFPDLRSHPSNIILFNLVADFFFTLKFFILSTVWYATPSHTRSSLLGKSFHFIPDGCVSASIYGQFFSLASTSWNAVWCYNLYRELENPVKSTKPLMKVYHVFVWGIAVVAVLVIVITDAYALASDQTCWVSASSAASWITNLLINAYLVGAIASLVYVVRRLRRGLSITRHKRRQLALYHVIYVVVFIATWLPFVVFGWWVLLAPSSPVPRFLLQMNAAAYCSQAAAVSFVRLADPRVRRRVRNAIRARLGLQLSTEPALRDLDDFAHTASRPLAPSQARIEPMPIDDAGPHDLVADQSLTVSAQHRFFDEQRASGYFPPPMVPAPLILPARSRTIFDTVEDLAEADGDSGSPLSLMSSSVSDASTPVRATRGAGDIFRHELMVCLFSGLEQAFAAEAFLAARGEPLPADELQTPISVSVSAAADVASTGTPATSDHSLIMTSYAPDAFAAVRALAGVEPADIIARLNAADYLTGAIHAHFSAAASGSFFCKSPDGLFVVKTMDKRELAVLLDLMPAYTAHLTRYPRSLLCRFYGAFAVSGGIFKTTYVIIMSNVLAPDAPVDAGDAGDLIPPHSFDTVFDLKGSTVNRSALKVEALEPGASLSDAASGKILKDNDFGLRSDGLLLGPTLRAQFLDQLHADTELLRSHNIMDYSLLVGIAPVVGEPDILESRAAVTFGYDELGGYIVSRNDVEQVIPREWYAFGLIDLLQKGIKQIRHTSRTVDISSISADQYAARMLEFFADTTI
ncbi:phosphatidylinositol-4-phosphate 5-kinase [Thecamonas trahens ATCC 50062]|uniref:Phosphatidylinositol-4-phosphate 5-kinase n=1 Tax=Thecamonas trahens ATCC 50062 TaxID=461836 RepID=A0A0L0DRJ2_THETB|nr:phosphatidylinositol-4-phosphate 5-kinase [Thecamonas trahens ATCC 50062]KNC54944.1 phosphatidylinositol-4-phosphate 5-kinase [Thecamonas trahens ATCC 50062]|eukprot:XP_013753394.1 phosphatidylinositol-4-phosphate 5-kinase [Thecamonas trahens ATCC 50062]